MGNIACVTLPSLICAMSETHESLHESKEEISGKVETLQDCKAATVNVKENSLYTCWTFISLFTYLCSCGRSQ